MTLTHNGGDKIKYYVIPKKIIYTHTLDYRRIIYYSFFAIRRGINNEVGFTINHLVEWTGFKIHRRKNTKDNVYENILDHFETNNYLSIGKPYKENTYIIANTKDIFDYLEDGFAIIYLDELDKILNCKKYIGDDSKTTPSILLLLLSYLRSNIMRRGKGYYGNDCDKPEFCYRMFTTIAEDIGLNSRTVSKGIKQLSELGLVIYESLPRFKTPNNEWHTNVTIFVDGYRRDEYGDNVKNYDYRQELKWAKEYVLHNKYQSKNNLSK